MGTIYAEIRQETPFEHPEEEALVALLRTTDLVRSVLEPVFKRRGLSLEQYDILRLLRRAPDRRLCTLEIAGRMVSRAPNITRLIDKLAAKGFVRRERISRDRRVVVNHLTSEGLKAVGTCSPAAQRLVLRCLSPLGTAQTKTLIHCLDLIRKTAHEKGD